MLKNKKLLIAVPVLVVLVWCFWWWQNGKQEEVENRYKDLVILIQPKNGEYVSSPVTIEGMARGNWFFEASFPIVIVNWDGLIIGEGIAQAQDEWMTTEYVPFKAQITFTKPTVKDNGWIILRKDNPSGLSEYDDSFEVPILFR